MVNKWTDLEIKALEKYYGSLKIEELLKLPELENRSKGAIFSKVRVLGLTKYKPRGEPTEKEGYTLIYFPLCPYSWSDGRVYEHHLVWWLNFPLDTILQGEIIHHINSDRADNRITNLQKLSKKDHLKTHHENGDLRQ